MNNKYEITKHAKVEAPESDKAAGLVAFQMITVTINFFGRILTERLDTKIMADGRQIIIDGNGFLKGGTQI